MGSFFFYYYFETVEVHRGHSNSKFPRSQHRGHLFNPIGATETVAFSPDAGSVTSSECCLGSARFELTVTWLTAPKKHDNSSPRSEKTRERVLLAASSTFTVASKGEPISLSLRAPGRTSQHEFNKTIIIQPSSNLFVEFLKAFICCHDRGHSATVDGSCHWGSNCNFSCWGEHCLMSTTVWGSTGDNEQMRKRSAANRACWFALRSPSSRALQ